MSQPERAAHIAIYNWFVCNYPELEADMHHFANERRCSPREGFMLKLMGVKRGVADFFLAFPFNGKAGLWVELKVGKNKPTKEQLEFLEQKVKRGYDGVVVWGAEAAKEAVRMYLKGYVAEKSLFQPRSLL